MDPIIFIPLQNLAALALVFFVVWAISVAVKDASIVDILWGPACALPALFTYLRLDGAEPRALLITVLACLWAARLALHLARRNLGHGEDARYRAMRARRKSDEDFALWSLPWVFGMQLVIAWFVSLPTQIGQFGPDKPLGAFAFLGVAIFVLGLAFETIGDWQLRAFKSDPANKGRLMQTGLWTWTRHPNYFGDAMVWTGLTLIALEAPFGWATILSPVLMIHFLVNVSGKAMLERSMEKRYPEFDDFKKRVSGFFPRPPSKGPPRKR